MHKIVGQAHIIPLTQVHVTSLSPPSTLKNEAHKNQPSYSQVQAVSEFVGRNKLNNLGSTALRSIREYFQNKLVLKLTSIHMA